jgi:hypothetical protein
MEGSMKISTIRASLVALASLSLFLAAPHCHAQVTASKLSPNAPSGDVDRSKGPCAQIANRPIPDRVLYAFFFTEVVVRVQTAAEVKAKGKDDSYYLTVYSREAGLTDEEGVELNQIALDWQQQGDAIQSRRKAAIAAHRAESPTPPKNPLTMAEFGQFAKEDVDNVESHIEELKSLLGDASFAKLDAYVKVRYHPTAKLPDQCSTPDQQKAPQTSEGKQ